MIALVIWVACSVAAHRLYRRYWLREFDWTSGDRRFSRILSLLGPVWLAAVLGAMWLDRLERDDRVLEERRGR